MAASPRARISRSRTAALAVVLSLAACSDGADGEPEPHPRSGPSTTLTVTEVWTAKGNPGVLEFGGINGVVEGPDGEVWVSESMSRSVAAISPDGLRTRIVTRSGDGPGELRLPTLMTRAGADEIAVLDLGRRSVDFFGTGGEFVRRVVLSHAVVHPKGLAIRNGRIVVSGGIFGNGHAIHLFSAAGELEHSWHPAPRTRNPRAGLMVAGGPLAVDAQGGILFSLAAPHRLVRYAPEGGAGRVIASDPDLLRPVGDDFIREDGVTRTFDWYFPQSRGVFVRPDGTILNVVRFHAEGYTLWEVYRPDGTPVVRQRVNRAYEPWAMTRDGDVLASYADPDTDEPIVTRLRIDVE